MDTQQPLLLTMEEAAPRLQISRSKAYQLAQAGRLPTVQIDRCRRVPATALLAWVAALEGTPA
jgi:excisionase family DNA binding protein